MKKKTTFAARMKSLVTLFLFLSSFSLWAQNAGIKGSVTDINGEPIIGATIYLPELKAGAYSNAEGIFSFSKLQAGEVSIRISFVGYDTISEKITLIAGKTLALSYKLNETSTVLKDIEITDTRVIEIEKNKVTMAVEKITPREITALPSLGAPDLAQYLQVIPGVVFTGDQGGQLYIRGGTPIMNTTLMDGAIIYNPFHSIGLFSVFDTDILRDVDVYTGGFGAKYGGRVSSVMDIKTRNGNFNHIAGKVHANPFTAGALLEGPMIKVDGKAINSWLVSARTSYLDKTSKALYSYVNDTIGMPYSFTDIYAKTTFGNSTNMVNLFGFYQNDQVNYGFPTDYEWNTAGGGTNFRFLPNNTLMTISGNLAFSNYSSSLKAATEDFKRRSSIGGFNGSLNFSYIFNSADEFTYGFQFLGFKTDLLFTNSYGLITSQTDNNTEAVGYFEYKKVFRKKIEQANGEVSYENKFILEPSVRFHYYNNQRQIMPEPRLRSKYNFNKFSLSLATGMYSQNLVSATSDKDIVVLFSGFMSAPEGALNQQYNHNLQTGYHGILGLEFEPFKNTLVNIEGWYKGFTQLTNVNREKIFPAEPNFITEKGWAYGIDANIKYQDKHWYLYASYGWAKVQRDNFSQVYYTVFDRRHNANLVGSWKTGTFAKEVNGKIVQSPKFGKESKWEFSVRWTLGSGFPFTQTQSNFEKLNFSVNGSQTNYMNQNGNFATVLASEYNGGRLPYFHRLDFSAKRRFNIKDRLLIEVNANIINAYNRQNIFYFDRAKYKRVNQLPLIPTAGVQFTF